VVLALGRFTPIYGLYRTVIWPEHLLRYPEKHMAAALLLWAALAGVGFDRLFEPSARKSRALLSAAVAVCLAAGLGLATLGRGYLLSVIASASQAAHKAIDGPAALSEVLAGGLSATVVAVLVPLAVLLAGHRRFGGWARPLLLLALVVHLIEHDWSVHVTIPREVVRAVPALLQPLPPPQTGEWPRLIRRVSEVTPLSVSGEARAAFLHHTATPNDSARFGFAEVPAYVIAGTARFDALAAASGRANLERVMDVIDIRYLLIDAASAPAMGMPVVSPVAFAGYVALENLVRRPRAFVAYRWRHGISDRDALKSLFDTRRSELDLGQVRLAGPGSSEIQASEEPTPCLLEKPQAEHVILNCQATQPGYAVLLDEWTHGWTATVDGIATPIERADVLARALPVAAGEHRIEMRYRTPGLGLGLWLATAGWLVFGFLLVFSRRNQRREQPGAR
jgi:Bacterial membrane protein YfhO